MQNTTTTGREARGSQRPPYPNSPVSAAHLWLRTPARPPQLPTGAALFGRVRVPLTLHVAPWARLYRLPQGDTVWCLRLADGLGRPCWKELDGEHLVQWARSSGLHALAREAGRLLAAARSAPVTAPIPREVA